MHPILTQGATAFVASDSKSAAYVETGETTDEIGSTRSQTVETVLSTADESFGAVVAELSRPTPPVDETQTGGFLTANDVEANKADVEPNPKDVTHSQLDPPKEHPELVAEETAQSRVQSSEVDHRPTEMMKQAPVLMPLIDDAPQSEPQLAREHGIRSASLKVVDPHERSAQEEKVVRLSQPVDPKTQIIAASNGSLPNDALPQVPRNSSTAVLKPPDQAQQLLAEVSRVPINASPANASGKVNSSAFVDVAQLIPPSPLPRAQSKREIPAAPADMAPTAKAPLVQKTATFMQAPPQQPILATSSKDSLIATLSPLDVDPLYVPRTENGSVHTTTQMAPNRVDLPQHVSRQIADALHQLPNRPVEISLNPEELGRVRLAVSPSETGLVVSILAERPETIELMRRHINSLEAAFLEIGYGDIAFSFSGSGQSGEGAEDHAKDTQAFHNGGDSERSSETMPVINLTAAAESGLDIRL